MHQYCYVSAGGKILGVRIGYNYPIETNMEGNWERAMALNRKLGVDETDALIMWICSVTGRWDAGGFLSRYSVPHLAVILDDALARLEQNRV